MANLSQQKRQRMLEFLQTIREEHKDDDDVLIAIGEIESELNAKKYGLVWEQHEEAVDVQKSHIHVFPMLSMAMQIPKAFLQILNIIEPILCLKMQKRSVRNFFHILLKWCSWKMV